jgi:acyl-CoA synthetase (NDP forming)
LAASDVTVDALFKQTGVIRTDTLGQLFDVATLLSSQPPPEGKRVAIVTNAGGPGILCADACEANGLEVVSLPEETRHRLAEFLPSEASLVNPVDMIASASAEDYGRAIDAMAACEQVDAIIVIFIPPLVTLAEDVARAIRTAATRLPRPIPMLSVFMSAHGVPDELRAEGVGIPSYAFPEEAAHALARVANYGVWRNTDEGSIPRFEGCRSDEASAIIASGLADEPRWLPPEDVARVLDCYGLPLARSAFAADPEEAARAAELLGPPVALKAVSGTLVHKTDVGGVRLDLADPGEVERAAAEMGDALRDAGHEPEGFVVQEMIEGGVEMLVGVVHDPSFGPVLACGAGGVGVELTKDVSVRLAPITDKDAGEMVRSLATFPLLQGYRGSPPADVAALEEVLLRVSALVDAHPEIVEMDCNPVKVLPRGCVIVDARIRVARSDPAPPLGARPHV